jgi:pilus assembly protein CpaF
VFGRRQANSAVRAHSAGAAAPIELGSGPVAVELATAVEPPGRAEEGRLSPASAAPAVARNDASAATNQPPASCNDSPDAIAAKLAPILRKKIDYGQVLRLSRANLALRIIDVVEEICHREGIVLSEADRRNVVTILIGQTLTEAKRVVQGGAAANGAGTADRSIIEKTKQRIQPILLDRIDVSKAVTLPPEELARQISEVVGEILAEEKLQLNTSEQRDLVTALLNDLLGLGPLEVLLADETVSDIMVNGPKQVYVERKGKLQITDVAFRDNAHVMSICTRIVSRIGRRVDETSPLCDARLPDGSRVNIIIPPLALDGPSISIRKFAKHKITLEVMERQQNLSSEMATVLKIAGRCRLNILISGGTGSGKTTLLNALSRMIDHGERIVTIEDAAELQLQQPHVVRLETRPANLEGNGEVTQRDLVKNALRMRPDRIILGEIRGGEALDMLQAMNTGHDGSLGTIHANRPREALTRLENMVAMTGIKLPHEAVRAQIAGALNMIVQISRMRDGVRRITHISEVVGMEGDVITMQDLFTFEYKGEDPGGRLLGSFRCSGLRPNFATQAEYFALDRPLLDAIARATEAAS